MNIVTSMALSIAILALPGWGEAQVVYQEALAPIAEEYGVGRVHRFLRYGEVLSYSKADASDWAQYGNAQIEMFRNEDRVWAIYDVSHLDPSIEVTELSLTSYILPSSEMTDHRTIYCRLTGDPRVLDAEACWGAFGAVYAWVLTPSVEGDEVTVLDDAAKADFEAAVGGSGLFMIGIATTDDYVWIKGWNQGRPLLTVTYESTNAVEPATWGCVKTLYR